MGVRIENLTVKYGDKTVIERMNLDVKDGEFFVILGSSGSGKTTLLRSIAGLTEISGGHIYIDDIDVTDFYPSDRNIAMVFQNFALYPHMTVFDNIALNLKIKHLPRDQIKKRVEEVASLLHIEKQLKKYPKQLSGGEQQRVGIARALVRDPSVFLMDEPLSNLDAKLRREMLGELRSFHERVRKTTIYVCHDQDEAMALADRIMVLNSGEPAQIGTPDDLYIHPTNLFVASFIGNPPMNLIECDIIKDESSSEIVLNGVPITTVDHVPGDHAILGIRPEKVNISLKNGVPASFDYFINSGVNVEVHLDMNNILVRALIPREELKLNLRDLSHGDAVFIEIKPGPIYLFSKDSGNLITEVTYDSARNVEKKN